MGDERRRRIVAGAAYSSALVILAVGLVTVLPRGSQIVPAPQAPAVGNVSGGGEACLGSRVASVQSGVFLDLHVPGDHGLGDVDLGPRIVGGRIDRHSGSGDLVGACAPGTPLAGRDATLTATVDGSGIVGDVSVAGDILDVSVEAATVGDGGDGGLDEHIDLLPRILLGVAIVIVAARLLGRVFGLINQPRVIGEIMAGILLGPSLLGLLAPEVTRYLFPAAVIDVLTVLAQFGLIFFMFLIGLELDHKMIRGSGHTAVLISHYSIILPLVLGIVAALVVYPLVGSGTFSGFALFMGAAMAITAFPVLARILTDTGLYKTRIGSLAITCAAVDDVTAWCILAMVVAIVRSSGAGGVVQTVLLAAGYVVVMLVLVRPLLAKVLAVHERRGRLNATVMSGLIAGLFLSAWATEIIGIHAIFGAFLFGAIIPRSRSLIQQINDRLEDVTVLFLLPVFFAVVGLSTQIGLVSGVEMWLLAGLVLVVAVAGKIGGSVIAGLAAGESLRTSSVIGVLMNARGLTEIVILTIGRGLGVISPALFAIMVLMALVTTFMTTPLVGVLYRRDIADAPAGRRLSRLRLGERRVMIGVTDPETATPLVSLASEMTGADGLHPRVLLTTVVRPPGHEHTRANLGELSDIASDAIAALRPMSWWLKSEGVPAEIVASVSNDPGDEILRLVAEREPVLIVVGSHQAYLGYRPLAGVTGRLLEQAGCDVAVLVAVDAQNLTAGPVAVWYPGEAADMAPLEWAAAIARGRGTSLRVISSVPVTLPPLEVDAVVVVPAEPTVAAALAEVEASALLVVAPPGSGDGVLPALREAVIERASVPVLVVRGYEAPAAEREAGEPVAVVAEVGRRDSPGGAEAH